MDDLNVTSVVGSGFPFDPDLLSHRGPKGAPPPSTLDEMKKAMGVLLVPKFIPSGFAYKRGQLMQNKYPSLMYEGPDTEFTLPLPSMPEGRAREMKALITVSHYVEADVKVASGYSQTISIRGGQGHLVYGGWGWAKRNGELVWAGWAPDTARTIYFEHESVVVSVVVEPAGVVTDEVLIQITESLASH